MAERSVRPTQDRVELVGTSGFVYLQMEKNSYRKSRQKTGVLNRTTHLRLFILVRLKQTIEFDAVIVVG
jgi:hypothetical protein